MNYKELITKPRLTHLGIGTGVGLIIVGVSALSLPFGVATAGTYGQYMRDMMSEEIKLRKKKPGLSIAEASRLRINPLTWTKHNKLDTLIQGGAMFALAAIVEVLF